MSDNPTLTVEGKQYEVGLCQCGCGESIAWRHGKRARFINGHGSVKPLHERYNVDPDTGCWNWNGGRKGKGYGYARLRNGATARRSGRLTTNAHRWVYEQLRGPIPAGLHLDHLCRNRLCVNPDHLEPVTPAENVWRGAGTRLRPEQAADIKARTEESPHALAVEYGITVEHVRGIHRGASWRGVAPRKLNTLHKEASR